MRDIIAPQRFETALSEAATSRHGAAQRDAKRRERLR